MKVIDPTKVSKYSPLNGASLKIISKPKSKTNLTTKPGDGTLKYKPYTQYYVPNSKIKGEVNHSNGYSIKPNKYLPYMLNYDAMKKSENNGMRVIMNFNESSSKNNWLFSILNKVWLLLKKGGSPFAFFKRKKV